MEKLQSSHMETYNPSISNYSDKRDTMTRMTPMGPKTGLRDDSPPYSETTPELRARHRHDNDAETESLLGKQTRV